MVTYYAQKMGFSKLDLLLVGVSRGTKTHPARCRPITSHINPPAGLQVNLFGFPYHLGWGTVMD